MTFANVAADLTCPRTRFDRRARKGAQRAPRSEAVDQAANAILHSGDIEVQQIAKAVTAKLKIAYELRSMNVSNPLDRLDFDDDATLDQKVEAVAGINSLSVIEDRKHNLALVKQTRFDQFMSETRLVGALQQPGSERLVDSDGATQNQLTDFVLVHSANSALLCALGGSIDFSTPGR
jgi:hypothetical protein